MKEVCITAAEERQRLDKFLKRYLPEAESSFLYKMLRKKNITLNEKKATGKELLKTGDTVRIWFSDETFERFRGTKDETGKNDERKVRKRIRPLEPSRIVYEDEQLLIINKPAGILSQKADSGDVSINEMLRAYLEEKGELTPERMRMYAPSVVNRLDRNTSGLIIAAKTLTAARELSEALKKRTLEKFYLALVKGKVEKSDRIRAWLIKDPRTNTVRILDAETENADPIETTIEPLLYRTDIDCTLLKVGLITGKTHQIRSHLASIGHPLAGDVKYGESSLNRQMAEKYHLKRQFLHAWKITFPAEDTWKALSGRTVTAPLAQELQEVLGPDGKRIR